MDYDICLVCYGYDCRVLRIRLPCITDRFYYQRGNNRLLILCPMASKLFRELFGTLQKKSYICKQKQRYGHITKIDAYEENSDGSSCLHLHNDNSDGTVGSRRRFEVF